VTGIDARRRRSSDEAASAQRWFKWLGVAVVIGSAVAALASGLLLYGSGSSDAPAGEVQQGLVSWVRSNMTVITAVQMIGLFAATAAAAVLAARDYERIWTEARRKAESDRICLLEAIIDLAAEAPGTGPGGRLRQAWSFSDVISWTCRSVSTPNERTSSLPAIQGRSGWLPPWLALLQ
jgi:hypothetical protein